MEKQHRALPTVQTITTMRLSVLALFIALPAAAYAAVNPRHANDARDCIPEGPCNDDIDCCTGHCVHFYNGVAVRLIVHLL